MVLPPNYLTQNQTEVVNAPLGTSCFLTGPSGTGKTTAGVERLLHLIENGIPGNAILILVPQRTLASPYYDALNKASTPPGCAVSILTIGGLARRMIDIFWPIVADEAGFKFQNKSPKFLTLETAQYYMGHIVRPRLVEGFFDNVTLDRNRLYSQILDNLNKAAVHGFPHTEIGERLKSSWVGDPGQTHIYDDTQTLAIEFRQYCLDNNLLDFSLQIEIFIQILWPNKLCMAHLRNAYHHLIIDNVEEDTPITADLLRDWIPYFESSLIIFDQDAGYRRFLGADPDSTFSLGQLSNIHIMFDEGFVSSKGVTRFGDSLAAVLSPDKSINPLEKPNRIEKSDISSDKGEMVVKIPNPSIRFFPEMLDWVADQIAKLINGGTTPGEIVVLAPYLSDALRYALVDRLDQSGIPSRSHRPSRSLRDEPSTRCMLTLAKLSHPLWGFDPQNSDVAYALLQAIGDMDLVRAQLLSQYAYHDGKLISFDEIDPQIQDRITYVFGERYENLASWIFDYIDGTLLEPDHFLSKLFGELLSQPGFGFHFDFNAGTIAATLVESVQKFRWVVGETLSREEVPLGLEYINMVEDGVIAAQYLSPWQSKSEDSVFLAPAFTFLMSNQPVDYQFWLNVGGRGWYERLYQPLTHPYVLSRGWPPGRPWTDLDETESARETLFRISTGLVRRCRRGIFLGLSKHNEQGYEQKGELLRAIDQALRSLNTYQDY
jgi:hypothetical protein